jgi:SAM-dependent methyltransferase
MQIVQIIPKVVRNALRPAYYTWLRYWTIRHPASIEEIHRYWKNPDSDNDPHEYATQHQARSKFLVKLLRRYVPPEGSILELGCNTGRNLNAALQAGYRNLKGIEINSDAAELMKKHFPELAKVADIRVGPIEHLVRSLENVECVFTMAVLVHIHPSSDWVFPELAKRAATVITIELETGFGGRWFPRNYRKVFEGAGMRQVEEIDCGKVPEVVDELANCTVRVFQHKLK